MNKDKYLYLYVQRGKLPLAYLLGPRMEDIKAFMGAEIEVKKLTDFNEAYLALLKDRDDLPFNRTYVEGGVRKVIRGDFLVFARKDNGQLSTLTPECRKANNTFLYPEEFWEDHFGMIHSKKVYLPLSYR